MPVLIVIVLYVAWIWRQPIDRRLKQHRTGPVVFGLGLLAVLALWLQYRPAGISLPYLAGSIAGVCSVYFMAVTMLLAARPRRLEIWFGGVDSIYLWHKRAAYLVESTRFGTHPSGVRWLVFVVAVDGFMGWRLWSTVR